MATTGFGRDTSRYNVSPIAVSDPNVAEYSSCHSRGMSVAQCIPKTRTNSKPSADAFALESSKMVEASEDYLYMTADDCDVDAKTAANNKGKYTTVVGFSAEKSNDTYTVTERSKSTRSHDYVTSTSDTSTYFQVPSVTNSYSHYQSLDEVPHHQKPTTIKQQQGPDHPRRALSDCDRESPSTCSRIIPSSEVELEKVVSKGYVLQRPVCES